jgi:membrane protease YdiL (CAAX protease family)
VPQPGTAMYETLRDPRVRLSVLFYGVLTAVGLAVGALLGHPLLVIHPEPWLALPAPIALGASVTAGLLLTVATTRLTRVLVGQTTWARALHVEFRHLLGPMTRSTMVVFALGSGLGEELLFRGALQPTLGLVATSLLFGLVHLGPNRRFWPWTAWATAMGFLLGAIHEVTGHLAGAVLAHALINFLNLRFIQDHRPGA